MLEKMLTTGIYVSLVGSICAAAYKLMEWANSIDFVSVIEFAEKLG